MTFVLKKIVEITKVINQHLNDHLVKVPCLEIDGLVLTQSVAIMEYLADRWLS